jgi:hypothetical protein
MLQESVVERSLATLDTQPRGHVTSERRERCPESECPCARREKSTVVFRVETGAAAIARSAKPLQVVMHCALAEVRDVGQYLRFRWSDTPVIYDVVLWADMEWKFCLQSVHFGLHSQHALLYPDHKRRICDCGHQHGLQQHWAGGSPIRTRHYCARQRSGCRRCHLWATNGPRVHSDRACSRGRSVS